MRESVELATIPLVEDEIVEARVESMVEELVSVEMPIREATKPQMEIDKTKHKRVEPISELS